MDHIFFSNWKSIIRILVISICAYSALIVILRLSGKRTLSKMSAYDFVVTVAIGSTLSSVILTKSVTLSEGILAFIMLVLLQFAVTFFSVRSNKFANLVKATPKLIVYKGKIIEKNLRKERLIISEIYAALRESGMGSIEDADAVVLETDGTLTVVAHLKEAGSVLKTVEKGEENI